MQHLSGTALSLLSGAQTSEVLCGTRHDVGSQFHFDAALGRAADGNVEEDDWIFAHFDDVWVLRTDGVALQECNARPEEGGVERVKCRSSSSSSKCGGTGLSVVRPSSLLGCLLGRSSTPWSLDRMKPH